MDTFNIFGSSLTKLNSDSNEFKVKSYKHSYEVEIINKLTDSSWYNNQEPSNTFYIIDSNIADLYPHIHNTITTKKIFIEAFEENKNLNKVIEIINELDNHNASKNCLVIVIGGGIIQDIASMACGIYKRGIPWCFIPTTLLAMADSAIGSKASLNHNSKNLLGMFSPPSRILMATSFINTLSNDCIISGIGEIFKLCAIGGNYCLENAMEFWKVKNFKELIKLSQSIKIPVVEKDEFDKDIRLALNYGHTFGHALESASQYNIPHGIAVMYGMIIVNEIMTPNIHNEFNTFLLESIPQHFTNVLICLSTLIYKVSKDKKNINNKIGLIILDKPGKCSLSFVDLKTIETKLKKCLNKLFKNIKN